jgi:dTMP kinase
MTRFVTFEGGEGSGKSTLVQRAAEALRDQGEDVLVTSEPEGTPLGRYLWDYYRSAGAGVTAEAELFLFAAARAEHVRTVIGPALEGGRTVLCDRFADSTVAYQGYGRGLDLEMIEAVNEAATGGLTPDLTLLLDVPAAEGLRRARALEESAAKVADAIGAESLAFHERVREGFLAVAREDAERVRVIDASRPAEVVLEEALAAIAGAGVRLQGTL